MIDQRGSIVTIASGDFKCVQLIESKKGAIRSNHMHKKGGHWLYVLKGRMLYREYGVHPENLVKDHNDFEVLVPPSPRVTWDKVMMVEAGEKVWTGPWIYHQTEFLEDTTLVSCAITPLDHESYEADTIRWGADSLCQLFRC